MRSKYTRPRTNATTIRIIKEAYYEGFPVKEITRYFGFKGDRVYKMLDIQGKIEKRRKSGIIQN